MYIYRIYTQDSCCGAIYKEEFLMHENKFSEEEFSKFIAKAEMFAVEHLGIATWANDGGEMALPEIIQYTEDHFGFKKIKLTADTVIPTEKVLELAGAIWNPIEEYLKQI